MRKALLALLMLAWTLSATAQVSDNRKTIEPDDSPEAQEMNSLTEKGLETAIKTISKSGGLYPFGLVLRQGDKIGVAGYTGDKENPPPAEQWAEAMIWQLRKSAKENKDIRAIAVFRLHRAETRQGSKLPGVWALVDHRDHRPWTVFLPLNKGEDGKHTVGELVYYPTPDDQEIFLDSSQ